MTELPQIEADPYPWPLLGPLDPRCAALLVIDMQVDFADPRGYIAQMGYDIAPLRRPIAPIRTALDAARAAGLHVIHTRQGYRADLADLPPFKQARKRRAGVPIGAPGPAGRVLVRGEVGWQIIAELSPLGGEPVIDKTANSAFWGTDLEPVLQARGIAQLALCGNTIDVCVHSSLRDANDRGYECLLIADACGAIDPAIHAAAVDMVKVEGGVFGCVTDAASFAAGLTGQGAPV